MAAVVWLPAQALHALLIAVMAGCALEFARVNRLQLPTLYAAALIAWLIWATNLAPGLWAPETVVLLFTVIAVVVLWILVPGVEIERRASRGAVAGFGFVYLWVGTTGLVYVRSLSWQCLLVLIAAVAIGDSAAYYGGKAWGKRKFSPNLSPNKTWAGAICSMVAAVAVIVGWVVWTKQASNMSALAPWLGAAVATNAAAQAGDLLESAFKRENGVKDSGNLLPGHGGVWDRIDALLLAAPVFALANLAIR